jgi:hypothetical membrane protein
MWCGVLNAPVAVLVITIDGLLRPGYSPISQVVSDLGVGPHAGILNTDLEVSGLLSMLFALGFSQALRPWISRSRLLASTALLILTGAGIMNAGLFTEFNPLHTLGFFVAFGSLALVLWLIGLPLLRDRAWQGYGWYSLISSLVLLLLILALLLLLFTHVLPESVVQGTGLVERLLLLVAGAWPVVTASRFFALERPVRRPIHVTRNVFMAHSPYPNNRKGRVTAALEASMRS